jgi:hypothetical protein
METRKKFSRRHFVQAAGLGLGGVALGRGVPGQSAAEPASRARQFVSAADALGRVVQDGVELKLRPDPDSQTLAVLGEDTVVHWLREVVGPPPRFQLNWRWVETPEGYLFAPRVQPVRELLNSPLQTLSQTDMGPGMWAEVSVPYVDLTLYDGRPRSPGLKARIEQAKTPRLYYSQVIWIDEIRTDAAGAAQYRIREPYGSYGDIFWAAAEAFRPLTAEELNPLSPEVSEKQVLVDNTRQTLSCFEGGSEVFYCRVSTGVNFDAEGNPLERSSTPRGSRPIWRKLVSVHMSGGTTGGGWDLPGVAWVSLFVGSGVAVHSTFWHNNFGMSMSRGCVNARPEDAKFVFRWTLPSVPYIPGDVTVSMPGGTRVEVVEG